MSNKKLSFVEAVKSGKDFRCVKTEQYFQNINGEIHLYNHSGDFMFFSKLWLTEEFEIIEVKKELTASEIEEAFEYAWANSHHADKMKERLLKKLGF